MSKKILYGAIGAVLLVFLIVINGAASAKVETVQPIATFEKEDIITATGTGKVSIKPDVAYIQMGVMTINKDARKAQEDNKTTMNKVIEKLKSMGIDDKDIQTTSYEISPQYSYQDNKQILEGYQVENIVKVTVRDIDKVGDILDAAAREGINRSYGISFGVIDSDSVYKEALKKAIDNAKGKAEVMAEQAGVSLQKPVAIYEGTAPEKIYQRSGIAYDTIERASSVAAVPISSGELEIEANVVVVYQIQ